LVWVVLIDFVKIIIIYLAAYAAQDDEYYDYPNDPFTATAEKSVVAAAASVSSSESHSFHLLYYYFMRQVKSGAWKIYIKIFI